MNQQPQDDISARLAKAQETIAHQAYKITELQQQGEREQFAQELRLIMTSVKDTNIILAPFTHSYLLEMVVTTAAHVISARAGSLFLIDEKAQDLVFEVAIGPVGQQVKKFRVPLGHGIAGMVALSGQPMAIANTPHDERLAIDIANAVNYIPQTILCVPLFYDDHVIGVVKLLDKIGADSFSLGDMESLGSFATIAAVAIAQSQAYHDQQSILTSLLHVFGEDDTTSRQSLYQNAVAFSDWLVTDPTYETARELALLVHELIMSGETESEMCKNILQSFVVNLRNRKHRDMVAGIR